MEFILSAYGTNRLGKILWFELTTFLSFVSLSCAQIPSTLGWYQIPNTQLAPHCPTPTGFAYPACQNVIAAWGGGAADTKRNRLLIWGGGHVDYSGNEVYALDLNALTMMRIIDPTLNPVDCAETQPDGHPSSRHTYYNLAYLANVDRIFSFSGAPACSTGIGSSATWILDLPSLQWARKDPTTGGPPPGGSGIAYSAYDPNSGLVFIAAFDPSSPSFWSYNPNTNTYTQLISFIGISYNGSAVLDPSRKLMFVFGDNMVWQFDISNPAAPTAADITAQTSGCANVYTAASPGLAFDSAQKLVVAWRGGNSVYQYNPDTKVCTQVTYANGPTASCSNGCDASGQQINGTFGRFAYFPNLNVFAVVNDWQQNAYTLRLTNGTPPPPPPAPVITSALTASGAVGAAFSYQITASNSPASFNATGLPAGLSVNTSNGLISGTPTAAGTSSVSISATNAGGTGSATLALTIDSAPPPPPGGAVTSFQLTSPLSGTLPFTIGLAFKKGDVPTSAQLSIPNQQVITKRTWNDGSVKTAIASGRALLAANTPLTVTVTNGSFSGTSKTCADIQTANPSASVQLGSIGTVNLPSLLATPFRTWVSGPEMVECHYRSNVGSDATLDVWFYVRLYADGRMWVRATVYNGYLDVNTAAKSYVPTVIIGGKTVYNNGASVLNTDADSAWSVTGWIGGDPQITPTHDAAYLEKTAKFVPNYLDYAPSQTVLNGLYQNYLPMANGDLTANMRDAGFQYQIGLFTRWDALWVTSRADARAYKSVLANASALNSYDIIYHSSASHGTPRPTDFPNWSCWGPPAPACSANGGGVDTISGTYSWDIAHHPNEGYLAYLITGDYFFYQTMLDQAALCYLANSSTSGNGTTRDIRGVVQTRGEGWCLRTLATLAATYPIGDTVGSDYQAYLANAITTFMNDGNAGTAIGYLGTYETGSNAYSATHSVLAPFQEHFLEQSVEFGFDLEPLSNMTNWTTLMNHIALAPVGILGPCGVAGSYCGMTQASAYTLQVADVPGTTSPSQWYPDWGTMWTKNFGATSSPTNTLGPASLDSGDPALACIGQWGNLFPAIAYAVDHGAPGASAAWARVTGATNWNSIITNCLATVPSDVGGWNDTPIWGIVPRSGTTPPPADTTPPSVPTGLMAVAISSNSIMANWSASTDNVGVTGYKVFRCQGAGCTPSAQVATTASTSLLDAGLTASTTYVYKISAFDAAGNVSALSASVSAVTLSSSSVSSNQPPVVSPIGTNATDVDPATPGLQIYDNTSVTYTGTASDPNGGTITWQWLYTTNGGAPVLMASGTGTVQPFTFNYPAGIAPKTYVWILSVNNGVSTAQQTLTVNVIARPSSPPPPPPADPTPGLKKALVYPNPVVKADPTIRAMVGVVDSVEITIFDVSGHVVNSGSVSGAPMGIINGQYYYDYKWTGSKASGTYFAVIHGKAADGTIVRARVKFAVVQ